MSKYTKPSELVVGRRYHVSSWHGGANFVLEQVDGDMALLRYPKRTWKLVRVPVSRLRNTKRHSDEVQPNE